MKPEIIKKLILSANTDDNLIGYSFMAKLSFKEIIILFEKPGDFGQFNFSRSNMPKREKLEEINYNLANKYHVHDYGVIAYFYNKPAFMAAYTYTLV